MAKRHRGMKNSMVMSFLGFLSVSNLSLGAEEANNIEISTGTELWKTREEKKALWNAWFLWPRRKLSEITTLLQCGPHRWPHMPPHPSRSSPYMCQQKLREEHYRWWQASTGLVSGKAQLLIPTEQEGSCSPHSISQNHMRNLASLLDPRETRSFPSPPCQVSAEWKIGNWASTAISKQ